MILSIDQLQNRTFDVCVIGTGPAGVIFAFEYVRLNPSAKLLLIEFGPDRAEVRNRLDDSISVENELNHHLPYECTNKGFGGSSATWGGRCVMYDEVDFLPRKVVGDECTWTPRLLEEVQPFLGIASDYFECGEPIFNLKDVTAVPYRPIAEGFRPGPVTDAVLERWSMPTRFGKRYRAQIDRSDAIELLVGWQAHSFCSPAEGDGARTLRLQAANGEAIATATAKVFVIAAGTQETTRLLLKSPDLFTRIGGPPSALGRYYQGHVSGKIASVRFYGDPKKTDFGFIRDSKGIYLRRRLQCSTATIQEHDLLNTAVWLDNPLYFNPAHKNGAMSFMYLAMLMPILGKRLAPPAIAHSITKGKVSGIGAHVWNILKDLPGSLSTPALIFFRRYCLQRKLPGVFLYSSNNLYALHFHAEQVPDPENRMELDADGETLRIHYGLTERDVDCVIRTHRILDEWLRSCGCGELQYWFPPEELPKAIRHMSRDGIHQSGTTRIADDSKHGVVDTDLKVFGTSNVYVCSSSAFPTSSQANPTFLLGAFAARLARHIATDAVR
jgi:hypothetical protein